MAKSNEILRTYDAIDVTSISNKSYAIDKTSTNLTSELEDQIKNKELFYSHTELYENKAQHLYTKDSHMGSSAKELYDKNIEFVRVESTQELANELKDDFINNNQSVNLKKISIEDEVSNASELLKKEDPVQFAELGRSDYFGSELDSKGNVDHLFYNDKTGQTSRLSATSDFKEKVHEELLYKVEPVNESIKTEEIDDNYSQAYIDGSDRFNNMGDGNYENPYNPGTDKQSFEDFSKGWADTKEGISNENLLDQESTIPQEALVDLDNDNDMVSWDDISKDNLDNVPDFPEFEYAEVELNESIRAEELDTSYNNASHEERLALDSDDFHYSRTEAYENGDVKHLFLDDTKTDPIRIDASEELAQDIREELKITKEEFFNSIDLPENAEQKNIKSKIKKEKDQLIDPSLDRKFTIVNRFGQTVYSYANDPNKVAIKESDSKISTKESNPEMVKSVLQIAEDKGWETIRLNGTKDFKREAWLEGNLRGLKVIGYAPTEQDLKKLERESEKRGINRISEGEKSTDSEKKLTPEKNKISDLKEAMASLTQDEAIKKHPELKKVYEIEPSAVAFYQSQKGLPKNQENQFVRKATDRAIEELVKGKELPSFEQNKIDQTQKVDTGKNINTEDVSNNSKKQKDIDFD